MRAKIKRHPITLLEIMIVILLIGIIGGVLSYNLKGTLNRGKQFRTEEAKKRLQQIIDLEIEQNSRVVSQLIATDKGSLLSNADNFKKFIIDSGFVGSQEVDNFVLDGWKNPYTITRDGNTLQVQ